MNCLIRIRQRYPDLAQSDKKLADYLLSQPDTARHLSSQQLAAEAGVSQSSVVKFAQKMGFKGFPALKLAISEALSLVNTLYQRRPDAHLRGTHRLAMVYRTWDKMIPEQQHALREQATRTLEQLETL